jgi:ketosteroid isomerase-like protein
MAAKEDAELVRRGYAAFNAGDMETLTELFDENASWHTPGRSSIAGDHEGRDASRSRTAGSSMVGSTSTTSTPGMSSGRRP